MKHYKTRGELDVPELICTSFLSQGPKESTEENQQSNLGSFPGKMWSFLLLLLLAFLLSPRAEAETGKGTLISGATDLSHLLTQSSSSEDNSITVVLGAHNIRVKESTQQVIPVRTPIPHPKYNSTTRVNDIMLLQEDSRGPLVCGQKAQGIVSFGKNTGKPPRVYTRIKYFVPWIKRTMKCFNLRRPD
ncbi:granzyme B-like isoform X2 [Rhinolophus sinicus]|uniref:granzyme B-like isoform X2 n=1 Tax=Rhinolophus sinicus TaxID=89399 RepID=UPI003D7B1C7A